MNGPADSLSFDIVARSAERKVAALILDDLTGASRAVGDGTDAGNGRKLPARA